MAAECDVVLKVILVGNSGVGKSALLKSFMVHTWFCVHPDFFLNHCYFLREMRSILDTRAQ